MDLPHSIAVCPVFLLLSRIASRSCHPCLPSKTQVFQGTVWRLVGAGGWLNLSLAAAPYSWHELLVSPSMAESSPPHLRVFSEVIPNLLKRPGLSFPSSHSYCPPRFCFQTWHIMWKSCITLGCGVGVLALQSPGFVMLVSPPTEQDGWSTSRAMVSSLTAVSHWVWYLWYGYVQPTGYQ